MFRRKGQSTLEYIIVLTAIVSLLIWFTKQNSTLSNVINGLFDEARQIVEGAAAK